MAWEHFDYDPVTGLTEYLDFSADGKTFSIRTVQDVEPFVDYAKFLANTGGTDHNFRGEGWLYAIIPPGVQAEMFKKNINILDKADTKRMLKEINTNYPYLKTTHRHHA
jgi:hypothetical protein